MIPDDVRALCEARAGDTYLDDATGEKKCLEELGIEESSEFFLFFSTFVVENMVSAHSMESLVPICDVAGELNTGIVFAWETWEVPERYIAMTTLEGEGGYFYDKKSGAVVDFELQHASDLYDGNPLILANSIFRFMRWFLSPTAEPRGYSATA